MPSKTFGTCLMVLLMLTGLACAGKEIRENPCVNLSIHNKDSENVLLTKAEAESIRDTLKKFVFESNKKRYYSDFGMTQENLDLEPVKGSQGDWSFSMGTVVPFHDHVVVYYSILFGKEEEVELVFSLREKKAVTTLQIVEKSHIIMKLIRLI